VLQTALAGLVVDERRAALHRLVSVVIWNCKKTKISLWQINVVMTCRNLEKILKLGWFVTFYSIVFFQLKHLLHNCYLSKHSNNLFRLTV
jgi:hypothetical protein